MASEPSPSTTTTTTTTPSSSATATDASPSKLREIEPAIRVAGEVRRSGKQRKRASFKRSESFQLRSSLHELKNNANASDPVQKVAEAMAPRKQEAKGTTGSTARGRGAKTNQGPTGRTAVGPLPAFNLEKLKAKLLPKRAGRAQGSSLATINETDRRNLELEKIQNHEQKMQQLRNTYIKDRERELDSKHNKNKGKRFTPEPPQHVKFLHSKFRQVFQPFQKNSDTYETKHQLKTHKVHKSNTKDVGSATNLK